MFPDLIEATTTYWRQLDEIEAAYRRDELTAAEVDAQVQQLMQELGHQRRRTLRAAAASLGQFIHQQREALLAAAAIGLLGYGWLVLR